MSSAGSVARVLQIAAELHDHRVGQLDGRRAQAWRGHEAMVGLALDALEAAEAEDAVTEREAAVAAAELEAEAADSEDESDAADAEDESDAVDADGEHD